MESPSLWDLAENEIRGETNYEELRQLFRALSPHLLSVLRHDWEEGVKPAEDHVQFLRSVLRAKHQERDLESVTVEYVLGYLDALGDLLNDLVPRTLAEELWKDAQKSPAKEILAYLHEHGRSEIGTLTLSELAAGLNREVKDIMRALRWMENFGLIAILNGPNPDHMLIEIWIEGEKVLRHPEGPPERNKG